MLGLERCSYRIDDVSSLTCQGDEGGPGGLCVTCEKGVKRTISSVSLSLSLFLYNIYIYIFLSQPKPSNEVVPNRREDADGRGESHHITSHHVAGLITLITTNHQSNRSVSMCSDAYGSSKFLFCRGIGTYVYVPDLRSLRVSCCVGSLQQSLLTRLSRPFI